MGRVCLVLMVGLLAACTSPTSPNAMPTCPSFPPTMNPSVFASLRLRTLAPGETKRIWTNPDPEHPATVTICDEGVTP
jgi:hypothetical protein